MRAIETVRTELIAARAAYARQPPADGGRRTADAVENCERLVAELEKHGLQLDSTGTLRSVVRVWTK